MLIETVKKSKAAKEILLYRKVFQPISSHGEAVNEVDSLDSAIGFFLGSKLTTRIY